MQIWISKTSDVPVREQLTAQIKLAILSQDLKQGQKLPSTREVARRFQIHSNTVSAAYRELTHQGWVEMRAGSGIYVRKFERKRNPDPQTGLDRLIVDFLQAARREGHSLAEIQMRIRHWLRLHPPDHFLVIDPDPDLREILQAELETAIGFRVVTAGVEDCMNPAILVGAIPIALSTMAEIVAAALPPKMPLTYIQIRSISDTLKDEKRPVDHELVSVASHWPAFLNYARSVLGAVRIDPDSLSFRDAREPGWHAGLRTSSFVITDAATARKMPRGVRTRVFRIIADSSLDELRGYVERFLTAEPRGSS
jgi:DNA-binding transcriptional regulator YhcF (GntR family)